MNYAKVVSVCNTSLHASYPLNQEKKNLLKWSSIVLRHAHNCASTDDSNHTKEPNYKTQNTHNILSKQSASVNVTCEENTHKDKEQLSKNGKCVCATKSLQ